MSDDLLRVGSLDDEYSVVAVDDAFSRSINPEPLQPCKRIHVREDELPIPIGVDKARSVEVAYRFEFVDFSVADDDGKVEREHLEQARCREGELTEQRRDCSSHEEAKLAVFDTPQQDS